MEKEVSNAFEFITTETEAYRTQPIPLVDGWDFHMPEHLRKSFLYKHSKFSTGENDGKRPFKNVILPILNVAYRSEGFDVKDVVPFVDDEANYYKSFLVKKYHPIWARKNGIDTEIDRSVESYVDYGLTLVENVNDVAPRVVDLQSLAFCDQTDILSGPICEKLFFSPEQLAEMPFDKDKVELAILMSKAEKQVNSARDKEAKTPGKYIEVFKLRGVLPEYWLYDENRENAITSDYVRQVQFVCYYRDDKGARHGITLYKGIERENPYKALKRDEIFGRACGFGGVEELFEDQTWINYSEIHIQKMLKAASLMVLQTADPEYKVRNRIADLEKNEILVHKEGMPLSQIAIQPQNINDHRNNTTFWQQHGREMGSASDPQLGLTPASGTPLGTTQIVTAQGMGIHDYRRGKIATFWEEIYRDWVLPHMVREMNKGQKFIDELSLDELQYVGEALVDNLTEKSLKKAILSGEMVGPEDREVFKRIAMEQFRKGGNKRFMEALKDDLKGLPVDVRINIAGKQKNLVENVDKLSKVFQMLMSVQDPNKLRALGKNFNEILEESGLSPIDYTEFTKATELSPTPEPVAPAPEPAVV